VNRFTKSTEEYLYRRSETDYFGIHSEAVPLFAGFKTICAGNFVKPLNLGLALDYDGRYMPHKTLNKPILIFASTGDFT
jgi:hypothetical protein